MRRSLAPSQRNKVNSHSSLSPKIGSLSNPASSQTVLPPTSGVSHNLLPRSPCQPQNDEVDHPRRVFSVVYGKPSKKKHKTWDGDGILEVRGKSAILKTNEGKIIGQTSNLKRCDLSDGTVLYVGSKEVEISSEMVDVGENDIKKKVCDQKEVLTEIKMCPVVGQKRTSSCFSIDSPIEKKMRKSLAPGVHIGSGIPKVTLKKADVNLLMMPQPDDSHQWTCNTNNLPLTPVTVAPSLCKVLRNHQREGVTFLYRCVLGLTDIGRRGAILADEMGLGKTLQCITLVWTLLKQGPYGGKPVIKKALIVVPSSLVQNWKNEFTRWLGTHQIRPYVVDKTNRPGEFSSSRSPVLIISYEMYVKAHQDLNNSQFDLIICDEGHRLKNSSTQAANLLTSVHCTSRILLTGTPIQNDLQEFYSLVDFVNPGILGNLAEFSKNFEKPILASKEPHAPSEVVEIGQIKTEELNKLTSNFILRRTQESIGKYLPQKTEYVVFCEPSQYQKHMYSLAVNYWTERMDFNSKTQPKHLSVIAALKKICNHPILLKAQLTDPNEPLSEILKDQLRNFSFQDSGKLAIVDSILKSIRESKERLILVSNFTQTLDLLARMCSQNECPYLRFDGSTPISQRNTIVSQFNDSTTSFKVLLLSSKAGGVGLNLIGGSRLVLFDSDWNPATDLQAMARLWREGQKKNVHIYRLLTTGTIEEKIFQRQLMKTGLGESVVNTTNADSVKLSNDELRDLFSYCWEDECLTHTSLKCLCSGDGAIVDFSEQDTDGEDRDCQIELQRKVAAPLRMNQLLQWEHFRSPLPETLASEMNVLTAAKTINFVFRNRTC